MTDNGGGSSSHLLPCDHVGQSSIDGRDPRIRGRRHRGPRKSTGCEGDEPHVTEHPCHSRVSKVRMAAEPSAPMSGDPKDSPVNGTSAKVSRLTREMVPATKSG